jgi:lipoprotein-anchoring transpeptidase ErfK/SrfK
MKSVIFSALVLLSSVALASSDANFSTEAKINSVKQTPSLGVKFNRAQLNDPTSWVSEFEIVIVINKASKGATKQTLQMYRRGTLILTTKVSTGREQLEKPKFIFWGPKHTYYSSTNDGYYSPHWLVPLHHSKLWGTDMPWAVFFDDGIAIHQAPPKSEGALGYRASGGCVRVGRDVASYIFNTVQSSGEGLVPKFNRDGSVVRDSHGEIVREQKLRTLIVVEDNNVANAQ